jgi:hypothetical protein
MLATLLANIVWVLGKQLKGTQANVAEVVHWNYQLVAIVLQW